MERDQYAIDILAAMAKNTIKRLWIIIILLIVLLFITNGAWIWYESQYAEESWTFEATADNGSNAIANGSGEVYFNGGESESDTYEAGSENGR